MKRGKLVLCAILVATIGLGLFSACGGRQSNALTIGYVKAGYGGEWIEAIAEAYKAAHPGVEIELEGDSGMTGKIGTRLETGNEIRDIFMGLTTNWQQWAAAGLLEPMDDLYASCPDEGSQTTVLGKILPGMEDFGKVNGKLYALPCNDGVTGIVYNAKLFRENGVEVPTTVSELEDACAKFLAKGIKPFVFPGQVIAYWDYPVMTWWAQYEGVENFQKFYKFESPDVYKQEGRLKALEVFERLISANPDNYVQGSMAKNHTQAQMDFLTGKAAMIPNGMWIENEMKKSLPVGFEMRMMPTPFIDGAKTDASGKPIVVNNTMNGDFFIVPKAAPHKELAMDFLKFMHSEEMLKLYTVKTGAPRPFKYDISSVKGQLSPFIQSAMDIWENSVGIYEISDSPLYFKNLANKWPSAGAPYGRMISDEETAREVWQEDIDHAAKKWDAWLNEVGLK